MVAALCRVLFVTTNPPQVRVRVRANLNPNPKPNPDPNPNPNQVRMALAALDGGRHMSTLEGSEARRLVALPSPNPNPNPNPNPKQAGGAARPAARWRVGEHRRPAGDETLTLTLTLP